jgi:hypothetical protein
MKFKKLSDLIKEAESFEGKWELSPEHEVVYRERRRQTTDRRLQTAANAEIENPVEREVTIKGSLVAAEPDALVISVTTQETANRIVTGLVKLSGKWALDDKNRITFCIKRGLAKYDKLTFQGAWEINDDFQVTYFFETRQVLVGSGRRRRRVTKVSQELVFDGHWDISEKNRLTYLIGSSALWPLSGGASKEPACESAFRFRGTFETTSLLAKNGEIRYQAGIEYKTSRGTKKRTTRTITLFGSWKLSDDLSLTFEIETADGRRSEVRFGADLSLKKLQGPGIRRLLPDEISVDLVSPAGKPLGLELVLTKDLFEGNVQTFVRFRESIRETAVETGVKIPW